MNDFQFADMRWLHAIWGVAVIVGVLVVLELRGRSLLDRMVSPLMQSRLVSKISLTRRLAGIGLFGLSLLALVFAMMRPQWGMTIQTLARVDSQIMICLDVSKSMLAEDVVPNRLERAKAEIDSLLGLMDEGQQVGLTAFAGKATVMCPMTTDFGFLRLILAEAEPAVVGLGGTRIGEALQKAVDGFRETGDVNRLILLITDGEDHDSFPMDAAQKAKEKGVRIVSIGFGDEAGSKIQITDPRTGARGYVQDRNGVDVVSRLDGETLRDIALETEGAYIPAGTGALDLQSIFDSYIRSLLKGNNTEEERVIRNEAYQWFVLAAMLLFFASLLVTRSFAKQAAKSRNSASATAGLTGGRAAKAAVFLLTFGSCVCDTRVGLGQAAPEAMATTGGTEVTEASQEIDESDLEPRELYNRGIVLISTDPDQAERMLNAARTSAGVDGELRFRALYNLGWVEVNRADALLDSDPESALSHLEMAASRFRESIRIRDEADDARHNLEIISRRIIELRDAIAKQNPKELATRLDELITMQRGHQTELQQATMRFDSSDLNALEDREIFRKLGSTERQVLSDMEKFLADARSELSAIKNAATDQPDSESQIKAAQIESMLQYIESSIQGMSKARSFTRRMQSSRAFVRWASALTDAKRGRDQLRDPIEVLSVLIADGGELTQLTRSLAASKQLKLGGLDLNGDDGVVANAAAPKWLSGEYLQQTQESLTARTKELQQILSAGVEQANRAEASSPATSGDVSADPNQAAQQKLLANVADALPLIGEATKFFEQAAGELSAERFDQASPLQSEGIVALMDAAEYFYDLRRLIEAMYGDQQSVAAFVRELSEAPEPDLAEMVLNASQAMQDKNLSRAARLDALLDEEIAKLGQQEQSVAAAPGQTAGSPNGPGQPAPDQLTPEQLEQQKQRFDLAKALLASAKENMHLVNSGFTDALKGIQSQDAAERDAAERDAKKHAAEQDAGVQVEQPPSPEVTQVPGSAYGTREQKRLELPNKEIEAVVSDLEELRRLFFTFIEHLRDTTQRQAELNDSTSEIAAQSETKPEQLGSLQTRQSTLRTTSEAIAEALQKQSEEAASSQMPGSTDPNAQAAQAEQNQANAETLAQASQLVGEGAQAMQAAAEKLEPISPQTDAISEAAAGGELPEEGSAAGETPAAASELDLALTQQQIAFEKLLEALKLLDDRQSPQNQDQQNQDQQQQDQNQDQQQQQPQEQQQQNMDANQMLQAIRDREAQRRRDKQEAQAVGSAGVDKDW